MTGTPDDLAGLVAELETEARTTTGDKGETFEMLVFWRAKLAIEALQRRLSEAKAEGERMRAALEGAVSAWEGKSGMGTLYEMPRAISNARAALSPPAAETPKEPT